MFIDCTPLQIPIKEVTNYENEEQTFTKIKLFLEFNWLVKSSCYFTPMRQCNNLGLLKSTNWTYEWTLLSATSISLQKKEPLLIIKCLYNIVSHFVRNECTRTYLTIQYFERVIINFKDYCFTINNIRYTHISYHKSGELRGVLSVSRISIALWVMNKDMSTIACKGQLTTRVASPRASREQTPQNPHNLSRAGCGQQWMDTLRGNRKLLMLNYCMSTIAPLILRRRLLSLFRPNPFPSHIDLM